jgi:hypothetical protein
MNKIQMNSLGENLRFKFLDKIQAGVDGSQGLMRFCTEFILKIKMYLLPMKMKEIN